MQQFTKNEQSFLNKIKKSCISAAKRTNIIPSLIGVNAIVESSWESNIDVPFTKNLFNLVVDKNWWGKCYSKDTQKTYNSKSDCKEIGAILLKAYNNYNESINDYADYIISSRRSDNGPYRYSSLIGCLDYKECVDIFLRNGYYRNDDLLYKSKLINIIEKYKLYEWDDMIKSEETIMSKRNRKFIKPEPTEYKIYNDANENDPIISEDEQVVGFVMTADDPTYRVRLDWNKPNTQLIATRDPETAIKEASKHEGYRVYVGEDGEVYKDPWIKEEEPEIEDPNAIKTKSTILPTKGQRVILNNTPVYRNITDENPFRYFTGNNFYYYDSIIVNNRAKITIYRDAKTPDKILGYIDLK